MFKAIDVRLRAIEHCHDQTLFPIAESTAAVAITRFLPFDSSLFIGQNLPLAQRQLAGALARVDLALLIYLVSG